MRNSSCWALLASLGGKLFAVRRPGVVADPAEAFQAAPKGARDSRRQPGVDVLESADRGIAARGFMKREKRLPALARTAHSRIEQEIRLGGEAKQRGTKGLLRVIRQHQLRDKERIAGIGQRVIEALGGVNGTQRGEVFGLVFADLHRRNLTAQAGPCRYRRDCRTMREPGFMPKPLPPRGTPLTKTPLPLEGKGAGPLAPPPVTGTGGDPNVTGADGSEPIYCE